MTDNTPTTMASSPAPVTVTTSTLRQLVEDRLGQQWADWAQRHPHLAEALDRTRLVETTVASLRQDPAFVAAIGRAEADQATLVRAAGVLAVVDKLVRRALAL